MICLQRKSIEADIEYVPRPAHDLSNWTHWLRSKPLMVAPFFAAPNMKPRSLQLRLVAALIGRRILNGMERHLPRSELIVSGSRVIQAQSGR